MSAEYWVWLQQVLGNASETVHHVVREYGDAKAFYLAEDEEKIKKCRLSKSQAERLHKVSRKTVYNILKDCRDNGIRIVSPLDDEYSKRLWAIADPPCVLYVKGKPLNINELPVISIVGPRKISDYGRLCAEVISDTLASCGFVIVSGGAVGGDSSAHKGAIKAGGYTIAVLGGGILSGYLKANADLRETISCNGCLISEDPPKASMDKGTFQRRNRIISGLANGVVVIEGAISSGTLITARHACDQGRDVFVIPGSPSLPQYEGSNRLMNDGAKALLQINDIIEEYFYLYPKVIHKPTKKVLLPSFEQIAHEIKTLVEIKPAEAKPKTAEAVADDSVISDNAKLLMVFIREKGYEPFFSDELIEQSKLDAGTVLATLTELEIFGFIKSLPGGQYCLI